jgi:hypothetical protein
MKTTGMGSGSGLRWHDRLICLHQHNILRALSLGQYLALRGNQSAPKIDSKLGDPYIYIYIQICILVR